MLPFEMDADVVEAFTQGGCLRLALALEEATGYPVFLVANEEDPLETWSHACNRLPDGSFVDVRGLTCEEHLLEDWSFFVAGEASLVALPAEGASEALLRADDIYLSYDARDTALLMAEGLEEMGV